MSYVVKVMGLSGKTLWLDKNMKDQESRKKAKVFRSEKAAKTALDSFVKSLQPCVRRQMDAEVVPSEKAVGED